MEVLRQEAFLDAEYRPQEGCNATLMIFIAGSITQICNIHRHDNPHAYIYIVNNRVVNDGNSISEARPSESMHGYRRRQCLGKQR